GGPWGRRSSCGSRPGSWRHPSGRCGGSPARRMRGAGAPSGASTAPAWCRRRMRPAAWRCRGTQTCSPPPAGKCRSRQPAADTRRATCYASPTAGASRTWRWGPAGPIETYRFDGKTDPQIVRELLGLAGHPEATDEQRIEAVCRRYVELLSAELGKPTQATRLMVGVAELLAALEPHEREERAV